MISSMEQILQTLPYKLNEHFLYKDCIFKVDNAVIILNVNELNLGFPDLIQLFLIECIFFIKVVEKLIFQADIEPFYIQLEVKVKCRANFADVEQIKNSQVPIDCK